MKIKITGIEYFTINIVIERISDDPSYYDLPWCGHALNRSNGWYTNAANVSEPSLKKFLNVKAIRR